MENVRRAPLICIGCLLTLIPTGWVLASGGWFDAEPPHSLKGDLDLLPAKSLGQIIFETEKDDKSEPPDLPSIESIIGQIGTAKPAALAAQIDTMVKNKRRTYTPGDQDLNVLYDVRDAITTDGPSNEARKAYCLRRQSTAPESTEGEVAESFAKGDPMRPHLLYLQGASRFAKGDRVECRSWFEEIVKSHPNHPRVETARFLIARCALSATRSDAQRSEEQQAKEMSDAIAAFNDYIKRYPKGRYIADAHGWIGALLWHEKPAEALEHYIAQLEDTDHPECRKSAAHMLEKVLATVVGNPEGDNAKVLNVVAKHPRIAQAAVYYVLNAPETDPADGKYDDDAALREWRLTVLPLLAKAVATEESRYQGEWSVRLRAMLAQASSAAGNQEEALKLTNATAAQLKKSDDLMFARLVALQRARQAHEAATIGRLFLQTFPQSPLLKGAAVRTAHALVDDHRSGEAYAVLCLKGSEGLNPPDEGPEIYPPSEDALELVQSGVYSDLNGDAARHGLVDTILNFAPLPELEAALTDRILTEQPECLGKLKEMLAGRKAAAGDYAGAAKLADEEEFLKSVAKFETLTKAVDKATGRAKAEAMMAMGDAFAAEAEEDTQVQGDYDYYGGISELDQRENARTLGYPDPDKELESRRPMRHATRWWLRAARSLPKTDLSAQARLKVLEAMEKIAMSTEFDFVRAEEVNASKVSRDIYDILQKENPGSAEAAKAVYWSFEPAPVPKNEDGSPATDYADGARHRGKDDYDREFDMAVLLGGYNALHYNAFGEFDLLSVQDDTDNEKLAPIRAILDGAAKQPADWEKSLSAAQLPGLIAEARAGVQSAAQMGVVNVLEDLALFHQVPGLPADARQAYVQLRLRAENFPFHPTWTTDKDTRPPVGQYVADARKMPGLAPVQDFVDYAELYANEADRGPDGAFQPVYPSYKDVEAGCRAFLDKYPKSLRREACYILLMRAIHRQMPERYGHVDVKRGTQELTIIKETGERYRPDKLLKAIVDYEREYPKPHYPAEVRNYRGIIAWRTFDYDTALKLTLEQLADLQHPDLRREAAVRLANIFADFRSAPHRLALAATIKKQPDAMEKLKAYAALAPQHRNHPLRCMGQFLKDQFGW